MSEENKNTEEITSEEKSTEACVEEYESSESAAEMQTDVADATDQTEECERVDIPEVAPNKPRKSRTVSIPAFLLSSVALVLATLMLTYSICTEAFKSKYASGLVKGEVQESTTTVTTEQELIDLLGQFVDGYFYGDADKEKMLAEALKAYMAASGDPYANYYTLEELLVNVEEDAGRMKGVGVNIVNDVVTYLGVEVKVLKVYNVMDNSPALKAGLKPDDMILYVGIGEDKVLVHELGYNEALDRLLGDVGTQAEFVVLRKNGEEYEEIEFSITRDNVETMSVKTDVFESDSTVGILKIDTFDYTTPKQFKTKVEELRAAGCTRFIIDMRYNPGGFQVSVQGLLSFFLNENDVYMQTKDKAGNVSQLKVAPVTYTSEDMQGCNVDKADIGIYRDLDFVVLCNAGTASAAELFVANIKDYGLATVVGDTTFGKGSMQTTYTIRGGLLGAVKLTTHHYFSGGDTELVGYNGVGIKPDVEISLSEEAYQYNFYVLPQDLDDQLLAAVEALNEKNNTNN